MLQADSSATFGQPTNASTYFDRSTVMPAPTLIDSTQDRTGKRRWNSIANACDSTPIRELGKMDQFGIKTLNDSYLIGTEPPVLFARGIDYVGLLRKFPPI